MSVRNRLVFAIALAGCGTTPIARAQTQGPSTAQTPYVLPVHAGVTTVSIVSNGNGTTTPNETHPQTGGGTYRMVGSPDGLGLYDNGDGTFTVLMNHELGTTAGITRAHGQLGAFVSQWTINKNAANLQVIGGRDLTTSVVGPTGGAPTSAVMGRFCSGDLAPTSAYSFNTLGTTDRIFLNGEEVGSEGRVLAHIATGTNARTTFELPRLGRFSIENAVANPFAQTKTVVVGTDDTSPGQVYVYVGSKTSTGNAIEKAGLNNGSLYGVKVTGITAENATGAWAGGASTAFTLHNFGDVSGTSGATLQTTSAAQAVTEFRRPEDGAWDPRAGKQNDFYFATTNGTGNPSRLWRMRFTNIADPSLGGQLHLLLDGQDSNSVANGLGGRTIEMMDNITIDSHGRVLIQEDPGGSSRASKVWLYDIDSDRVALIAEHDRSRFGGEAFGSTPSSLPTAPFINGEESSGIIDAKDILGDGWFLLTSQAHYSIGGELVEGGQLMAMYVDPTVVPEPGVISIFAGAIGLLARRRRR